jgi:methylated-DNA-protein-cysteine methyltransferase-like protein
MARFARARRTTALEEDASVGSGFEAEVIRTIRGLRRGEVATYGEVAEEAGSPGAARAVGSVLARVDGLPWWRVVGAGGRLVAPAAAEQARRLKEEGVRVVNGRVRAI